MQSSSEEYYATLPINVSPDVSPSSLSDMQPTIGLIGMGAMGRMYAKYLGGAGWCRWASSRFIYLLVCDQQLQDSRMWPPRKVRQIEVGLRSYV